MATDLAASLMEAVVALDDYMHGRDDACWLELTCVVEIDLDGG